MSSLAEGTFRMKVIGESLPDERRVTEFLTEAIGRASAEHEELKGARVESVKQRASTESAALWTAKVVFANGESTNAEIMAGKLPRELLDLIESLTVNAEGDLALGTFKRTITNDESVPEGQTVH